MPIRELLQCVDLTYMSKEPAQKRASQRMPRPRMAKQQRSNAEQVLTRKRRANEEFPQGDTDREGQKRLRDRQYRKKFGPNYLDGNGMSIGHEEDNVIEVESYAVKVARNRAAVNESLTRLYDEYFSSSSPHLDDDDVTSSGASSQGTTQATISSLSTTEEDLYDQVLGVDLGVSQEEIDSWDNNDNHDDDDYLDISQEQFESWDRSDNDDDNDNLDISQEQFESWDWSDGHTGDDPVPCHGQLDAFATSDIQQDVNGLHMSLISDSAGAGDEWARQPQKQFASTPTLPQLLKDVNGAELHSHSNVKQPHSTNRIKHRPLNKGKGKKSAALTTGKDFFNLSKDVGRQRLTYAQKRKCAWYKDCPICDGKPCSSNTRCFQISDV